MNTGIELIAKERQEQIEKHQFTPESAIFGNRDGELLKAAHAMVHEKPKIMDFPVDWRDNEITHKMMNKPLKERLIIAGTLLAAEIDRLNYIEEYEVDNRSKSI